MQECGQCPLVEIIFKKKFKNKVRELLLGNSLGVACTVKSYYSNYTTGITAV